MLTNQAGTRQYGNCLIFYEPISQNIKDMFNKYNYKEENKFYVPKALCLLSQFSMNYCFKQLLKQLFRIQISQSVVPIEVFSIHELIDSQS